MSHQLKFQSWMGATGKFFINDVEDLAGPSAKWWAPARMLNMSLTDYILMLKNEYNCVVESYSPKSDFLYHYWWNYNDAHRFVLFINKEARKRNYVI